MYVIFDYQISILHIDFSKGCMIHVINMCTKILEIKTKIISFNKVVFSLFGSILLFKPY